VTNLLAAVPKRVRVVEVGPRDGLQNELEIVATEDKAHFIELLAGSGLKDIEVSSFVSPKRVPQLADAEELFARIAKRPGVRYSALVPNEKGLERALATGVRSIAFFTAASETFSQKNVGASVSHSLAEFGRLMQTARENTLWVRAYVSTAFVCPYEGPIKPAQVLPVVRELVEMGVNEISLGDTIGQAAPDAVARLTEALECSLPLEKTAYHFHDTNGLAVANVLMALQFGVGTFDSSAGGLGGCPFAPGAAGNLATEKLLSLLHGMGIETGVDIAAISKASEFLESKLGRLLKART
jgi:isopropylmalate/homocitrate/citramalate synthase